MPLDSLNASLNAVPMNVPEQPQQATQAAQPPGMDYISQENPSDEREAAFESAFKDVAYNIFTAKFPELSQSIITFKIIKSAINTGDAVGAFILSLSNEILYAPVVMSDNNLKPIEIVYSKRMDKFLPFNKEWLTLIVSTGHQNLGEPVKAPETVPSDVDISTMIRPPIDGRISYAMDLSSIDHLSILEQAENSAKEQYAKMLKEDKRHLKFAAENFKLEDIKRALVLKPQEKKAEEPGLDIVDFDTPTEKIKSIFGQNTPDAMSKIAALGFAYQDNRKQFNKVAALDMKLILEEPTHSGPYTVYDIDGTFQPALIIVNPQEFNRNAEMPTPLLVDTPTAVQALKKKKRYIVILPNGDYCDTENLIATPSTREAFRAAGARAKDIHDIIYEDKLSGNVNNSNVTFIKTDGDILRGTEPHYIDRTEVTADKSKKYLKLCPYAVDSKYIHREKEKKDRYSLEVIHGDTHSGRIMIAGHNVAVVPKSYKVLKLGEKIGGYDHCPLLKKLSEVLQFIQNKLSNDNGKAIHVSNLGADEFAIDHRPAGSFRATATKIASEYSIPMDSAIKVLAGIPHTGKSTQFVVVPFNKEASIFTSSTDGTQVSPEMVQQNTQQAASPAPPTPVEQPAGPQLMNVGMNTNDPNLYSLGVLNSLAHNPDIKELLSVHSSTIEKALDSVGRMLLTFWIKGASAKESLGEDGYFATEEALRSVFKGIGSLLLKINRHATTMPDVSGY